MREQRISSYRKIVLLALWLIVPCAYGGVVLTSLVSFDGTNENLPNGLTLGKDGNFYGTTFEGGSNGLGTIFKLSPKGTITTLISFNFSNGKWPSGKLVQGGDSNFYGETVTGGENGNGTIFRMTPSGTLTTLATFGSDYLGSWGPSGELVLGKDGNYYGTTGEGGTHESGTVFKMAPNGVLTTLASFSKTNGAKPDGELVLGSDGNFYGATMQGGKSLNGTVFRVTPNGLIAAPVMVLKNKAANPLALLIQGTNTSYYGRATGGGRVFTVAVDGSLDNGGWLLRGKDGSFYGTTFTGNTNGGPFGYGTIFQITRDDKLTTLVEFKGANGANPVGGLVQSGDGNFYGVTSRGGLYNHGTIFQLTVTP